MAAKKGAKKGTSKKRSSSGKSSGKRSYHRSKSTGGIPKAATTVAILMANKDVLTSLVSNLSVDGVKSAATQAIQPNQIKKDIEYAIIGYSTGYVAGKVAPKIIKNPMNKMAKKINEVF